MTCYQGFALIELLLILATFTGTALCLRSGRVFSGPPYWETVERSKYPVTYWSALTCYFLIGILFVVIFAAIAARNCPLYDQ